jgi:hypothetical protein
MQVKPMTPFPMMKSSALQMLINVPSSPNPDHVGIIACTVDTDFLALAARIQSQLHAMDSLHGQLLRINRG